jgi:hypothetical protein
MKMNLENHINTETDIINIYFCKSIENNCINLMTVKKNLKLKFSKRNLAVYYKNDLFYIYDLSNDSQFTYKLKLLNHEIMNEDNKLLSIHSYKETKVSCYLFPSTNTLSKKSKYTLEECRINNRLTFSIKTENNIKISFITYKHSINVDIPKMNYDLNEFMQNNL